MNQEILAALVFCAAAAVGQLLHAVKKWADGASTSPLTWLTTDIKHTVSAMIGNSVGMLVFIGTGVLGPIAAQPNGWMALALFGVANGFSADSALNKSTTQVSQ